MPEIDERILYTENANMEAARPCAGAASLRWQGPNGRDGQAAWVGADTPDAGVIAVPVLTRLILMPDSHQPFATDL